MSDVTNTNAAAWPKRPLGDIFRISGDQVSPMAFSKAEFVHYSIPAWDATGGPAIELGNQIESNKTAILDASVLVSKLNPRKPRVVAVPAPTARTCCSTEFICYQPKRASEDLSFWAAYFASTDFSGRLARIAVGSTNSHTRASPKETLKWLVPEVPPNEQRKIAQVLDLLNSTIHETEAIIAKLKAVKQGLLHDLLTRGIDANGELRPPQSEAPHLYKPSPLGWIPKEWEVRRLDEYCVSVADGTHDSPRPKESGYPLVTSKNLRDGKLDLTDSYLISEVDYKAIRVRSSVEAGDLLFGMIGTIGSPVLIESGQSEIATKNVGILRVGGNFRRGQFLKDWLNGDSTEKQLSKAMSGSTQRFIGLGTLRSLLVAEPDAIEMAHVVDLSSTAAERIDEESSLLCSLKALKVGLMDDLLTGRVRVTPLLQEAQHA